jgi:hypothetical protein
VISRGQMAEGVGFEPTEACTSAVFKSAGLVPPRSPSVRKGGFGGSSTHGVKGQMVVRHRHRIGAMRLSIEPAGNGAGGAAALGDYGPPRRIRLAASVATAVATFSIISPAVPGSRSSIFLMRRADASVFGLSVATSSMLRFRRSRSSGVSSSVSSTASWAASMALTVHG